MHFALIDRIYVCKYGGSNPEQELRFGGQSKDNRHFIRAEGIALAFHGEFFCLLKLHIFYHGIYHPLQYDDYISGFFFLALTTLGD